MQLTSNIKGILRESKLGKAVNRERSWRKLLKDMETYNKLNFAQTKGELLPYINKPGIIFSFDDSFRIKDWYKYGKDLFGYYDVKVTFNINAFHLFEQMREHTQEEIDMLLELQANGHEIAHHGFKHMHAIKYSDRVGVNKWIEDDILPLFDWIKKQCHSKNGESFKRPVSYIYPYCAYNERTNSALVPQYFKIVRGGNISGDNFLTLNHTGLAPSICIDCTNLSNFKHIQNAMRIVKQAGKNLVLMCHSILPEEVNWEDFGWGKNSNGAGEYRISPKMVQAIIEEAKKIDLEFYTTAELSGVATFIDPIFEKTIRKQLKNVNDKWISISELALIKELDLSNKGISNLDGIQYFLNLENLNLSDNNLKDIRLLKKLPKLKSVDISNNPIKIQ